LQAYEKFLRSFVDWASDFLLAVVWQIFGMPVIQMMQLLPECVRVRVQTSVVSVVTF